MSTLVKKNTMEDNTYIPEQPSGSPTNSGSAQELQSTTHEHHKLVLQPTSNMSASAPNEVPASTPSTNTPSPIQSSVPPASGQPLSTQLQPQATTQPVTQNPVARDDASSIYPQVTDMNSSSDVAAPTSGSEQ
jgi:hypothetical protein